MVTGSDVFRSCQAAHIVGCPISCLCWYACTLVHVAVVCATSAVESPGSCREGAGLIPAVRVAALPKRRLQVPGCSECASPPPPTHTQPCQFVVLTRGTKAQRKAVSGVSVRPGVLRKDFDAEGLMPRAGGGTFGGYRSGWKGLGTAFLEVEGVGGKSVKMHSKRAKQMPCTALRPLV